MIKFILKKFEIVFLMYVLLAIVFTYIFGIPVKLFRPWFFKYFWIISKNIIFVLLLYFFYHAVCNKSFKNIKDFKVFVLNILNRKKLINAFRYIFFLVLMTTVYTTIKQAIPLVNHKIYDEELFVIDKFLHFGVSPNYFVKEYLNAKYWNIFLDFIYICWFFVKFFVTPYFLFLVKDENDTQNFLATSVLVWFISVIVGGIWPSLGPCYYFPNDFPAQFMHFCQGNQISLKIVAEYLKEITNIGNGNLTYGFGIMALPSLHNAITMLYIIFFWHKGKFLRITSVVYAILIFIGSLLSGWHYAVDNYVGYLIVFVALQIVKNMKEINIEIPLKNRSFHEAE